MAEDLKLNPEIKHILLQRFHESTSGEIAALNAISSMFCSGIKSYPANTKGVIQAILQLGKCLGMWAESIDGGGGGGGAGGDLCCLLPPNPNLDYHSGGIIGDGCGTEDCPPTPHPHPHDPTNPCCGTSPDINPDWKYPVGGVECLHPDRYEYVNAGIVGTYCTKTLASPDCLVPGRAPYSNAGAIGCGNPNELHWVDYYWPARVDFCNAGFTGHNCTECKDPSEVPKGHSHGGCEVCARGGVENYRPEYIEYDNAGTRSDNCPPAYGKPSCLLPDLAGADYDNSGLLGQGDPETEDYVDYFWPGVCEYANAGLIGTGCAIGGDEWLDALDLPVEKGDCYIPYLSDYDNSGMIGGSWYCNTKKKPHTSEYYFTPIWDQPYGNSGAIIEDVYPEDINEVYGGVECWAPSKLPYTQCGFTGSSCASEDASPSCLYPGADEYANGGVRALITEPSPYWWKHYEPLCPEYDNAGVTGTNCDPPEEPDCCPEVGNLLPFVPDTCHTQECWLPEQGGTCLYDNAGLKTSRDCDICDGCGTETPTPVVVVSDQPPADVCQGTLWFNPATLQTMLFYCDIDTCQWVPASTPLGGTGGAQAIVSDHPPAGAICGSLWHDSIRQETRVFYDDGNTKQWVPTSLAKANSTETEALMRREIDQLRQEIDALKLAVAGKLSD